LRSEDAVHPFRVRAHDAVGLPLPRTGQHDVAATAGPGGDVLDAPPRPAADLVVEPSWLYDDGTAGSPLDSLRGPHTDYSHRLLRGSQLGAVGALVLIAVAAVLSARYGNRSLHVHQLPLALWGFGAAVAAVAAAALGSDPTVVANASTPRRVLGTLLIASLLACLTGVTANAGGVAGPSWVLFFPAVIVVGAVLGPVQGLLVGGAAAGGIYLAAGLASNLGPPALGRLVVILPAAPAAGWAAGALAGLAHRAAVEAAARRTGLEADVDRLAEALADVAAGDLSRVPAAGDGADPVATSLAVVFADTVMALRRLVRQMNTVTSQLADSAGQMSASAESTARSVDAQTSAVGQTTNTVEELAATASSIADIADRVSRFAGSTRRDVDTGAEAVQAAGVAMTQIAERVQALAHRSSSLRSRIGQVESATRLIDDLARRTSILAVNAQIEAARAGDLGQGFATVAAEVEILARRARESTAAIGHILAELEQEAEATARASTEGLEAVEIGTELQADVVDGLARITAMVDRTTAAAREISAATRQQRVASDAVVAAMSTVTVSSDRYRDGSHGHAAAARHMHELADALKNTLSRFRADGPEPKSSG
jgi:methyl-accepting chemotaxis protein